MITQEQANAIAEREYPEPVIGRQQLWPVTLAKRQAYAKAVTVEAIVNLAEEWNAYCVVTPADPDGIEDFRTRLLKLIQE